MPLKPTVEGMEKAVSEFLEPGEELKIVGWAWERGMRYYYIALTDMRLITLKLTLLYKVKVKEDLPLTDLENCSICETDLSSPPDPKLLSRIAETPLYVKTRDGMLRCFRFGEVLGFDNRHVPLDIIDALELGYE